MKRINNIILVICSLLISANGFSQETMQVYNADKVIYGLNIADIEDIKFYNSQSFLNLKNSFLEIPISEIDSITFGNTIASQNSVYIFYNKDNVSVINPFADKGVNITTLDGNVTVTATSGIENIEYHISGKTENGSLNITSDANIVLTLSNITLTNSAGAAINIASSVNAELNLSGTNYLSDGTASKANATLLSAGNLIFKGDGKLTVDGLKKHAIASSLRIIVENGNIVINSAASDGFHSEGFSLQNGNLHIVASGDGIDAGAEDLIIENGAINIVLTTDDVKGIKADKDLVINGGEVNISVSGAQSKGLSGKANIVINGGNTQITASGTTVLEALGSGYDTSYCSGIKTKGDVIINNGTLIIDLPSSNNGGKGISADNNIVISNGIVTITTAGNGATYTDENGAKDSYSSCCIKSDVNTSIFGGTVTCLSTGTAGKGISADGELIIGNVGADNTLLTLNVTTSGERFYVSGTGENADYANPKAIKSEGNLTVNSGNIQINCTQSDEGGEGLESKATLTVNGGNISIDAFDDCINAATHIQINGGSIYTSSRGNDAIDSNGTLSIAGGFVIANGTSSPEGGFDCDNSRFAITGGIVIGTGGSTSNPTTSACTQRSIKYTGTAGSTVCIKNASNQIVLLYQMPTYTTSNAGPGGGNPGGGRPGQGGNSNMVLLFSDPNLSAGSYTLQYGGTITGGTTVNGYNTGGTYSGGTSKSFTVSSMLTAVN